MLSRPCPSCQRELSYRTVEAYMRALQRQSQCRQCAAKIDPRQKIQIAPDTAQTPLESFWRLLDVQHKAVKTGEGAP
jgi:hypothetical protein